MNRGSGWRTVGVALIGLAASVGRTAAASESTVSPLRSCIAAEAGKLDFSGVVSVLQSGALTTFARGLVAGPDSPAITADTRFNLGSASKMFTAVAVAQLLDAGKIKLDDAIGQYVSGLTPEASRVTVQQLLDHSSGLGDYFAPQNLPALMKAVTLQDLLPLAAHETPAFQPGARFAYSDTGFLLLGLMVEHVSRQVYGDYLQTHVFGPAKMAASGLQPVSAPARAIGMTQTPILLAVPPGPFRQGGPAGGPAPTDGRPVNHSGPGGPPPLGPLRPAPEAALQGSSAGGAYSTAGDMQRFFAALLNGELTSAQSLQMLVSTQIVVAKADGAQPERDYGFGFGVGRFEGRRWFGHNGGAPGVNTEATVFPDDGVTVVVLANRDPPAASALFRRLRTELFDPAAREACER